ncbi:magnesium transporter MgtE N-terminal domain-containing protein [Granulicella sp. L46]|uniref:magnesium transporter MgtE N-terminal domain-containing protein n=1 Tax=Granulicella sp. L46 TaxID=1641865 RepID=UPI00131B30C5|nr:CBS domain-containing protein [Granulicella sp. L46]
MTELQIIPTTVATSASALLQRNVLGPDGASLGRVKDLAVDVSTDQAHVAALVLRNGVGKKSKMTLLPVVNVVLPVSNEAELRAKAKPTAYKRQHDYLLLDYDLLDQQIIDVDGRKVVRVNDVNLAWESSGADGETAELRIVEVEVGNRGAMRRLFKGLPVGMVDEFTGRLKPRVIPWDFVDLIERDPARRVRLKIGQERLSKLHPSDIADILEDLAPGEREAVFSSLPEETAAETLEEVDPKMQKALLQGLDSERAADILEEMDPGAAADALSELSDEESEAILEEMEPEERHEVEELLEFSADSAAGRMTTDYVSAPKDATVADAIEALREFEGDPDTITEIYLLDAEERLAGVVMLPRLVLSTPETTLSVLSEGHNVRCGLDASDKEVAELFDKYNLRSLPVVDHHGRVAGAIHAEQVIAQLREG